MTEKRSDTLGTKSLTKYVLQLQEENENQKADNTKVVNELKEAMEQVKKILARLEVLES
jgi:hypothetical protein